MHESIFSRSIELNAEVVSRKRETVARLARTLLYKSQWRGLRQSVLSLLTMLAACAPLDSDEGNDGAAGGHEIGVKTQALSTDYTDASGQITIRIKTCGWTSPAQHARTACSVDTDFVLVGGGAEIDGEEHPGALLTESYPDPNLTTWWAASKDHLGQYPFPHRLRAYAIGLQLYGVASSDLRTRMYLAVEESSAANHPTATAELPSGYLLIGGGARTVWSGPGVMLVGSFPDAFQWVAEAKDHVLAERGLVVAYAIGIASTIPGFGNLGVVVNDAVTYTSGAYGVSQVLQPTGTALTSIGGHATGWSARAGRLLADLIPFYDFPSNQRSGARVTTKDHHLPDSGETRAYALGLRKL